MQPSSKPLPANDSASQKWLDIGQKPDKHLAATQSGLQINPLHDDSPAQLGETEKCTQPSPPYAI